MSSSSSTAASRGESAILGALVGDAASLGTHWIYARVSVEAAVGGALGVGGEFAAPVEAYHAARRSGQATMYGEGLLCMARSLAATKGVFDESDFVAQWVRSFGVCGTFCGYADTVTRETISNYLRLASENGKATYPPASLDGPRRGALYMGVKGAATSLSGAALAARAVAIAAEAGAPEHAEWAVAAAAAWERMLRGSIAAADDQSNTLGKLVPAAVAAAGAPDFAAILERAVRVTQNDDDAVLFFVPLARAIEAAVLGSAATPRAAVEAALPHFDATRGALIREALAAADAGDDVWDVLKRFGSSCQAKSTAPVTAFMLARYGSTGFAAAIRHNMVGESAARACVIGAVLGALGCTPDDWLERVDASARNEAAALAKTIAAHLA